MQDTFDVDYGNGGGSPLLLQDDGNSTFKFDNAQNASFSVVWGGAGGGNVFDVETSSDGGSAPRPNVNVCVIQLDGIDEKSCANLDLDGLKSYIQQRYSSDYTRNLDSSIVIINPTNSDKLEFNGQVVTDGAGNTFTSGGGNNTMTVTGSDNQVSLQATGNQLIPG